MTASQKCVTNPGRADQCQVGADGRRRKGGSTENTDRSGKGLVQEDTECFPAARFPKIQDRSNKKCPKDGSMTISSRRLRPPGAH